VIMVLPPAPFERIDHEEHHLVHRDCCRLRILA
jgi:hypothetical protein